MDELIRDFKNKMHLEGKSEKTIKIYVASVKEFFRWFNDSFGDVEFKKLYRENILEYKSYLKFEKFIDTLSAVQNHCNQKKPINNHK